MRHAALLFTLSLTLALPARADCDRDPIFSSFGVATTCSFDAPCVEDQAHELTVTVDTACYPWWKPCDRFPFEACDGVEWVFGDGTGTTVAGSPKVSHVWKQPGLYYIEGRVFNAKGSKSFSGAIIVVRTPVVRVEWASDLYTIAEQNGQITLTLQRSGDLSREVTVLLTAGPRAATDDAWDRNLQHVQDLPVTIPAGVTTVPITLNVRDDDIYLGEQHYDVFVYDNTGEVLLPTVSTIAHTEVRIFEDEPGPLLSVHDVSVEEGDQGSRIVNIPHVLSQPLASELILWWEIGSGTATLGSDWATSHGGAYFQTLTIPAGQTRVDLPIRIYGDTQSENDETVVIRLSDPIAAAVTFSQPTVTVTIEDDDLYRLTPARAQEDVGTAIPLTLSAATPTTANVPLSSSEPSIVSVPSSVALNGTQTTFTAQTHRPGKATITASTPDGKSLQTEITSVLKASLAFARDEARVEVGKTTYATITTTPAVATTVLLESNKPNVLEVPHSMHLDIAGTATFAMHALQTGTAVITATLPVEYGLTSESLRVSVESALVPHIDSITPPFGTTAGGTEVTIHGSDFSTDCAVSFGGIAATSSWRDEQTLLATTPPHAAGVVDVVVQCGEDTTTLANGFRYKPARRRAVR